MVLHHVRLLLWLMFPLYRKRWLRSRVLFDLDRIGPYGPIGPIRVRFLSFGSSSCSTIVLVHVHWLRSRVLFGLDRIGPNGPIGINSNSIP